MDKNLVFLMLLGVAIIFLVILAGYKSWYDNRMQRKVLTEIALKTNSIRKGNTLSGQRHGLRFRFCYHAGFDEYNLPGMEIMLAVHAPVTLIIYRAPFKKIALKTGVGNIFNMNDSAPDHQWHCIGSNRTFTKRWLDNAKNRELIEGLMQSGCSMVKIGEKGMTGEWYTFKSSSALTLMKPDQVDKAINTMVKMVQSLMSYA